LHTVLISVLLGTIFLSDAIAGNMPVRVGVYENKPLVFRDENRTYQGLTIDVLSEVARREQWQLEYVSGTWPEGLQRLSAGTIDLMVGIAWSAERAKKYRFSEKTVLSNWAQIYTVSPNIFPSILSLNGKTVALMKKSIHSAVFIELIEKFQLQVTLLFVDSYAETMQAVKAGKADAALVNRLFGLKMAEKYSLVKTPIIFNPIEIRYAAPLKGAGELLQSIDAVLIQLENNHESVYYQSLERWFTGTKQTRRSVLTGKVLAGVALFLLLILAVIIYSRWQVHKKTMALQQLLAKEKDLRQALAKSVEIFRLSFQTSPDSININALDGTYLEINEGFSRTMGYSSEEVIGKTSVELNIWNNMADREKLRAALQQNGRITNLEAEFVRKDGTIVSGLMSANLIEIDAKQHILSITNDISVLKQQQLALQQAKELWQNTFDAIGDIITVHDADMHILQANRAACEFYGSESITGKFCFRLEHGTTTPCADCVVMKTFADGKSHYERVYHDKKEKTFVVTSHPIVSEQGVVKQVVQVARDITGRIVKDQERRLLASAIEQSTDTIVITDAAGVIRYANPAFGQNSGYSCAEAIGKNPHILQSGQHNRAFYRELWSTILSGKTWQGMFVNRKKDGELYREKATISPVKNDDGQLVNFIAVKQNITHERELEQQLQQAQKMESIGTLAGGIAHDFNNILGVILGYAQMAEKQLPESSAVKEDIKEIIVASTRAVSLVKQILTFSRQENEEFKPISLQFIIKEMIKLLKASLPATVEIRQMIDASCKPVNGDPTQLHQVLMNLCTNAKYALPESKGVISVSMRQRKMDSPEQDNNSGYPAETGYLDIEITDNGCGMDGQTMERVFDPFFTTKPKGQGTGLGLAVSYGIIQQHGGEITVTSEPGKGTTFHISLPTIDADGDLVDLDEKNVPPPRGSERIVLVDDEKHLVDITNRMLTNWGYTVISFTDSEQALIWMQSHTDGFDILVTDMTMPDVTGADLARKLLALRPELPIVLCTGFSEILSKEQAAELGIQAYLLKPVTKQQLAETLHRVLHP